MSKQHFAVFRPNQYAEVLYPCGTIARATSVGTKTLHNVTCKRCTKTEIYQQTLRLWKGYESS